MFKKLEQEKILMMIWVGSKDMGKKSLELNLGVK